MFYSWYLDKNKIICKVMKKNILAVLSNSVHPVQSARDLGVYVDGALTMRTHITHVLSSCYSALRQSDQSCRLCLHTR